MFMRGKTDKDRASHVLQPYEGRFAVSGVSTVVLMTWHELIEVGVATELQIRRALNWKVSKKLPTRPQHFISSTGFLDMLLRCDRVYQYYNETEAERRAYAELGFDFEYNSLASACDIVTGNGLITLSNRFARSHGDDAKVVDHVDRLGLAYVYNSRVFLHNVADKVRLYGISLNESLRRSQGHLVRDLELDERDKRMLLSPAAGREISVMPDTLSEAAHLLKEIRHIADVVLGVTQCELV